MMNSENWLSEATKGKTKASPEISALDMRRELPGVLRMNAEQAEKQNRPIFMALTPAAARRLADDVQLAITLFPAGFDIAALKGDAKGE